ncbi:MAG TPA: DUF488 family protein [Nitrospiria bacterium]|nr:DUF488 family protein [Nitrospiria bacterium]
MAKPSIQTKRVYDPPASNEGLRLLVMRYWPRGVKKERIDRWVREVSPSPGLIKKLKSGRLSWKEFEKAYFKEMKEETAASNVRELRALAQEGPITLFCGCAEEARCHRGLLKRLVAR